MTSFLNLTFLSDFLLGEIISKPISFSERVAKSSALFDLQTQTIRHRVGWVSLHFVLLCLFCLLLWRAKYLCYLNKWWIKSRSCTACKYLEGIAGSLHVKYTWLFLTLIYLVLFTLFQVFYQRRGVEQNPALVFTRSGLVSPFSNWNKKLGVVWGASFHAYTIIKRTLPNF